ncbi:MAG: 2-oxoglutarate dehydrogenase complex dihydrolipoyllysine-residue succinyltransferase [Pseudomonadota bacterium]
MTEILVPTLGESVSEATVATWLKKEGETVEKDEPIVELETDKVTLEVNAIEGGVLSQIIVQEGENVEVGSLLGHIGGDAANDSAAPKPAAQPAETSEKQIKEEAPVAPPAGGGTAVTVHVPTLGESVSEAIVATWMKKEGDSVSADEPIVELETDKVTLEVNAPVDGVITKIIAAEGDSVEVGTKLGDITVGSDGAVAAPSQSDTKKVEENVSDVKSAQSSPEEHKLSPAVLKMVNDNKLDSSQITGTGKDGRLLKEDVIRYMEQQKSGTTKAAPTAKEAPKEAQRLTPPAPSVVTADKKEREERVRMTRLRQAIAKRLKGAQETAAILTTFNEVDMTAIMNLRKQHQESFVKRHDVKLGFMSFFVKASVQALKEFPAVNAEIDGDEIVYKNYYDLGIAVSTDQGLIVPVVRDCDQKSFADIEKNIIDLGGRAREGKISLDEMQGGSFTITNGGVFGSLMATPILNAPQSAILGMHKIQQRPMVMPDGSIEARPMMYIALSYDHRIIDGKESVSFLVRVKEALEDPQRLMLQI